MTTKQGTSKLTKQATLKLPTFSGKVVYTREQKLRITFLNVHISQTRLSILKDFCTEVVQFVEKTSVK